MKKRMVFIYFIILFVFIAGVWIYKKNDERASLKDLPTAAEMQKWDASEIYELKSQIEEIPLDSCEEYFTNEMKIFLKRYENVTLDAVMIKKDFLSVIEGKNHKSLFNIIFAIDVMVDTDKQENSYEFAKELQEEILEYLEQYSYVCLKAKEININVLDRNQGKLCDIEASCSVMNETVFVEQPEDEYAVQTLAFQYSDLNPDFNLRKFGVIPETQELYVEYSVQDTCFEHGKAETTIAGLEETSKDIREYLMSQEVSKEFAAANQIRQLTISFYNGSLEEEMKFTVKVPDGSRE